VGDSSGLKNTGTIAGDATRVAAGKHGKALRFDGVNDVVSIADSASLDLTKGMTLEAWVRPSALGSTWRPVMTKTRGDSFSYEMYAHDDTGKPAGYARLSSDLTARSTSALPTGTWTHLAVTFDGATLRFYANGALKASKAASGSLAVGTGALKVGANPTWRDWFKGDLDDVRVWRKPLTAAQITADMKVGA
jgi:hypothetical protein